MKKKNTLNVKMEKLKSCMRWGWTNTHHFDVDTNIAKESCTLMHSKLFSFFSMIVKYGFS